MGAGLVCSYLFDFPLMLLQVLNWFYLQQENGVVSMMFLFVHLGIGGILVLLCKLYYLNKRVCHLQNSEKELRFFSYHDAVAGTCNRNAFVQRTKKLDEDMGDVAVLVCDIDGLKIINDILGHNAGDTLIRITGDILNKCCSSRATVYRMGGDEFLLLLTHVNSDADIIPLTQMLHQAVIQYNQTNSSLPLSLSMGWALPEDAQPTLTDLINLADGRMYQDKIACKDTVRQGLLQILHHCQ